VAMQGEGGRLAVKPPATMLLSWFDVPNLNALKSIIKMLPNVHIEDGKNDNEPFFVIFLKWSKYQVDYNVYERVKRLRYKKRCRRDVEEIRKEEIKTSTSSLTQIRASRFEPPTPQAVKAYALEIAFDLDGSRFCDFYAAKGWRVGNTPMKDWKAAVRTWKQNHQEENHGSTSGKSPISYADLARAKRADQANRKNAAAGALSNGIGDLRSISPEALPTIPGGHGEHGQALERIPETSPLEDEFTGGKKA